VHEDREGGWAGSIGRRVSGNHTWKSKPYLSFRWITIWGNTCFARAILWESATKANKPLCGACVPVLRFFCFCSMCMDLEGPIFEMVDIRLTPPPHPFSQQLCRHKLHCCKQPKNMLFWSLNTVYLQPRGVHPLVDLLHNAEAWVTAVTYLSCSLRQGILFSRGALTKDAAVAVAFSTWSLAWWLRCEAYRLLDGIGHGHHPAH